MNSTSPPRTTIDTSTKGNGTRRKPSPPEISRAEADGTPMLPDAAPRTLATAFIESAYPSRPDILLRHWRGDFYEHGGIVYRLLEPEVLRSRVAEFADLQMIMGTADKPPSRYRTNRNRTSDILDSLAGITQAMVDTMPAWLDSHRPDPRQIIAFNNGLLDVAGFLKSGEITLRPPSPMWFSTCVLPFDLRADAPKPKAWWDFLAQLWDEDVQSIDLLGEWFGYCLTLDTRLQKILMMIGPQRSGKGTIARVLSALVGPQNVCGPTLAGLSSHFGLWGLIGKQLAIISDARMSTKTDGAIVIERLLSISGEDSLSIDRKNKEPVSMPLPTRLMLISNELPKLMDSSGALADRFLMLVLKKSFLGNEDARLTDRLLTELPGIALWALKGLQRLSARGRFQAPQSSADAADELHDLVSPIRAFIRERCAVGPGRIVEIGTLFSAWREWCREQGRDQHGTQQTFGRDLRAAVPVASRQPRENGGRIRVYEGIGLEP
jgi:putative DNA primase/helicase